MKKYIKRIAMLVVVMILFLPLMVGGQITTPKALFWDAVDGASGYYAWWVPSDANFAWVPDSLSTVIANIQVVGGGYRDAGTVTQVSLADLGLTEGVAYDFKVTAYDGAGNHSEWSPEFVEGYVYDETPPSPPPSCWIGNTD
jgi:hypothetical protein